MRVSIVKRVWQTAGIAAIALFVGGIVAAANSIAPGRGGNIGAALLAMLLWLLAFVAAVMCTIAFVIARRNRGVPPERGFEVVARPPGGPTAG